MDFTKATLQIFSKLEHDWLYQYEPKPKTRILSIDGSGGSPSVTASAALIHLEKEIISRTGDSTSRIADFFDLVSGTGTGAVYAALLSSRPTLSAREAVKFVNTMFGPDTNGGFLRRCRRISGKKMEQALKEVLKGDDGKLLTLRDTCKPLVVPCYDLNSSGPFVFSRADASGSKSFDFELWKVCRATSATPSGFKPFKLTSVDGKTSCLAVDGGLVMNNPTAAAVTHVLHNKRDFPSVNGVEDLLVLSLGNSNLSNGTKLKFRRNGECSTSSLVRIALDGVSETVDQMVGNAFSWNRGDYLRIQGHCDAMGEIESDMERLLREKGVETLPFGGKRLMTESNGQIIENVVQRLILSGKSSLPPSPCKEAAISPLVSGR